MNTRNIIIAGLVVVIAVGGYFFFTQNKAMAPTDTGVTSETPANGADAKINIDAVCQGALAYMSFPDGASADAFVADCKEGKHPEVIERYKADMNLGAGAQI